MLDIPEHYNFYKLENMLKEDKDKFIRYLESIYEQNDISAVIKAIKSSGISVDLFESNKHHMLFVDILNIYMGKAHDIDEFSQIEDLVQEKIYFEQLFKSFEQIRTKYFEENEKIDEQYKVASYLVSLELHLDEIVNKELQELKANVLTASFDSAIESSGMILKYFMYNKNAFKGNKRNISPRVLEVSKTHVSFSEIWLILNDLLEYWKYSDVKIQKKDNILFFEICDKDFELNNVLSNERFLNLREGWQMNAIGEIQSKYSGQENIPYDKIIKEKKESLNYLFSTLYFGSIFLKEKVKKISLARWLNAYELLIEESKSFLRRRNQIRSFSLDKVCLSKSVLNWIRFFKSKGYSQEETETILDIFTFNRNSLDMIDCPFVKIDDNLVVIPTLTSNADAARALASNFLNRRLDLDFRGPGFEERTKHDLNLQGIINSRLYKKTKKTEYECDVAFVLDDELFFVECKAHVQPFSTRQHTNHLYKLKKETLQINRIAEFFEQNLSLVKEQLDLPDNFIPKNTHRIILTTSMMGSPLLINGVYIVDESAFVKFLNRSAPRLMYFDKGKEFNIPTQKFQILEGELTAKKIVQFLKSPPQISMIKSFYQFKSRDLNFINVKRHWKVNQTTHFGVNLNHADLGLIDKFLSK
ncbi:hypothetical protein ACFQPF_12875 [Fictibacillus iocasae]|uniref:NERD domain-containing protein n=1 Tax=Fictibacillus iocasae TaxID=2715437 RepID=A0ABW2NWY9_9BACL